MLRCSRYATETAQFLSLLEISHISGSGMSAEVIAALQGVETAECVPTV